MLITPNFKYEEFVFTNHRQFKLENFERGKQFIGNMRILAYFYLEPLRLRYGVPIYITSCFRCLGLHYHIYDLINNNRIKKGLEPLYVPLESQHLRSETVDFLVRGIPCKTVFDYIQIKDCFKYGQLILENRDGKQWIHLSLPTLENNMQVLIFENGKYTRLK